MMTAKKGAWADAIQPNHVSTFVLRMLAYTGFSLGFNGSKIKGSIIDNKNQNYADLERFVGIFIGEKSLTGFTESTLDDCISLSKTLVFMMVRGSILDPELVDRGSMQYQRCIVKISMELFGLSRQSISLEPFFGNTAQTLVA